MKCVLVAALLTLVLAGSATAQLDSPGNVSGNFTGNATGNATVNGTGNATGNGTANGTDPEQPATPASPFPLGLALLVVGAAVVVGLLVYAASRP